MRQIKILKARGADRHVYDRVCVCVYVFAGRTEGPLYELTVIENMLSSTSCVLTLLWVGLGPGALAAYLQAIGQSQVPPAQAQVIYSTTPLWAAGFAFVALDASDEAMGGQCRSIEGIHMFVSHTTH